MIGVCMIIGPAASATATGTEKNPPGAFAGRTLSFAPAAVSTARM
jgi:hypothetical protein